MKPFDLEAAKKGAKVCTREGRKARILCYDSGSVGYNEVPMPIIAEVFSERESSAFSYRETGRIDGTRETCYDLMMADDDSLEKLERGEYDRPDHIGEATEKVDWDYWRRMYAGMALQGLVASDKWRRMEMGDRVCVCVEMADALIEELKKEKK